MELTSKLLVELQRRLKVGNRRGVHLNAIPANSRYKFDLNRLAYIDKSLPDDFLNALLSKLPLKFRISWKDSGVDLNSLFEEDQVQLVKITKAFENLINQTQAIESEKGINTFGFGFPILARRDKSDNKLTVAPVLIWSLKIKQSKEFNTWEILRSDDDPIYINEVLINHLQNDSGVEIEQISNEVLDDGIISKTELIEICAKLIRAVNTNIDNDLEEVFKTKLNKIVSIGEKSHYEKLPLNSTNSLIEFAGLFSIFEVQKQNIINDYSNLIDLKGLEIGTDDLEGNSFQPISSIETDPSQQGVLHSLNSTRNILIQGPPGTGKSQTLTAVLVNALENNKKVIVVCEKKTALEVLHNSLIGRGLNYHCVLIKDIVKDRKTVVDSVRDRVDNSEYKRYRYNYSKDSLDNVIKKAKDLILSINGKHQKVGKKLIGNKSWTDIVGDLLAELKGNSDDNNLNIDKDQFNYSTQELNSLLDLVQKGQTLYADFLTNESSSFINPSKLVGDNPYIIEQQINDDFEVYFNQLRAIKDLSNVIKNEFFKLRYSELKQQIQSVEKSIEYIIEKQSELSGIISENSKVYSDARKFELAEHFKRLSQIISDVEQIFDENDNDRDLTNDLKLKSFSYKFLSNFSKVKKRTIAGNTALKSCFSELKQSLQKSKYLHLIELNGDLESQKKHLGNVKSEISKVENNISSKIDYEFASFNLESLLKPISGKSCLETILLEVQNHNNSEALKQVLHSIHSKFDSYLSDLNSLFQSLSKALAENEHIKLDYKFDKAFSENINDLSTIKEKLEFIETQFDTKITLEFSELNLLKPTKLPIPEIEEIQKKYKFLKEQVGFDDWVIFEFKGDDLSQFIQSIENLLTAKNQYFNGEIDFFTIEFKWFQFYNKLYNKEQILIDLLKTKVNWRKTLLINYLSAMLVNSASVNLPTNDNDHKELERVLNGVEKEQLKFIKEFWYSKQIDATRSFEQNNNGLSVGNLYLKKQGSKNIRLSLRQIVQKDADLFTTFFPIILTSPDVASNLFKGMNGYFDIVIFDEASQLRLEDNLPAILKGKQVIIAGDEHQMPPSSYFSKVFDGVTEDEDDLDEEDEIVIDKDNILLSCESLLDFGSELNFEKKYLDFHYRSKHPYLIDFSNYAFYNQRLKPLPNNFDYVPIKYIQVNGTFSDHTNEAEAEMVLAIIDKNIDKLPNGKYPSVGIATFNIKQRDLIWGKINDRRKLEKFNKFIEKINELEQNGFFIKNLENIQGDECDVIILSTTYGVTKEKKFPHTLLKIINGKSGYRLLNVIITRAKYKVYVCSSVPENIFLDYKNYLNVEGANNRRAVFFAYLAYCKAVSECNSEMRLSVLTTLAENTSKSAGFDFMGGDLESPFEEEVYQSLADHFGTEKLIPQLQFAGFRIDIVYDPKKVGVPKIAIECDGAKYHSSREAYLYDLHRQKILENHGFVFHRIWSTNWWRNSSREIKQLIGFIKHIESSQSSNLTDFSSTALAFTDDVEIIEEYISQASLFDTDVESATIKSINKPLPIQIEIFKDEVQINSKVHVKYVNNGKDINIQMVSTENNIQDKSGVQKVYYKSPLGNALFKRSVGDVVKIGNLDHFVEIIKIAN